MKEIIITSTILILMLILIRKLCWGKISRRLQYALWLLAVIRLLVPTQFLVSPFSVMNVVEDAEEAVYSQWQDRNFAGDDIQESISELENTEQKAEKDNTLVSNILSEENVQINVNKLEPSEKGDIIHKNSEMNSEMNTAEVLKAALLGIYIAGVCVTGCCIIWCNRRFYKKLAADRQYIGKEGWLSVYVTSQISTPCLFGFPIPSVYVTENAFSSEERKAHILLHEMTHYRHLDHIWAVVRSLCISLYWFHPLVWLAAKLSIEDSELACDEGTFLMLGVENREAYGRTLIEMTLEQSKKRRILYCATGMTSGKKEIKERIKAIALYKKQILAISAAVLMAAAVLAVCTAGTDGIERQLWMKKGYLTWHTFVVNDIIEKYHTDDYYLTIELEPSFVEYYGLSFEKISLPADIHVYEKVDVSKPYIGISVQNQHNNKNGQTIDDLLMLLRQGDIENVRVIDVSEGIHIVNQDSDADRESSVKLNADGSFRMAEYTVDLTGDKINEQIFFDVTYPDGMILESEMITEQMLWDKLWNQNVYITVKILEGKEETPEAAATALTQYLFVRERTGSGNLAVVRCNDRWCLMTYCNKILNDTGNFGYEIWQINASGKEPELVEEMSVSYKEPVKEVNSPETIDLAIQIGEKLDGYLSGHNTDILVNASVSDKENCYMYGSERGLSNGVRRQKAFEVFMADISGTGLELKISDYFYPTGMEPITALPEDAEERILRGEILYMEVSPENNTAGRLDLDGDGEKEVLYLEAMSGFYSDDGWDTSYGKNRIDRNGYRVRVNEQYYVESYCSTVDPILMAYSPNGKDILLAVYDAGPSGDPETFFYKYDDTGVQPAGVLPNDIRRAEIEDGTIKCKFRADMIQTEFAWGYFVWNGSEIVRRDDDIFYFVDDSEWRETIELPLTLLKEITVYEERSEDSLAITMKPQKVRNVASDQKEWIFLEAEDGTKGWIRVEYYGYFPSEEAGNFDLFDGLSMAG